LICPWQILNFSMKLMTRGDDEANRGAVEHDSRKILNLLRDLGRTFGDPRRVERPIDVERRSEF
jgi:hypothetical protein